LRDPGLDFGAFIAPFHPTEEDPGLSLQRDLDLVTHLDRLGLDEVWIGEHHSAGWGTVGAPELVLATAAARTERIRLGTGVVSLPYHHPFMVATRIVQLDHLSRGRAMLGVGAGASAHDATVFGLDPDHRRAMMEESLEAVLALLRDEEPVSVATNWFALNEARLQIKPFRERNLEVVVASNYSTASVRLAGRHELGVLSLAGMLPGGARLDLAAHWAVAEREAAACGLTASRSGLRVVLPVHLAPSRAAARDHVRDGTRRWMFEYFRDTLGAPVALDGIGPGEEVDALVEQGGAIVGTPADCVEAIGELLDASGGFGSFLVVVLDWTTTQRTHESFELLARQVVPAFRGATDRLERARVASARAGTSVATQAVSR